MLKDKPIFSNQYGALVMAFVPFIYGIISTRLISLHLFLALSWLFLYFCSYPFLSVFSKKQNHRYKKWAVIYFIISLIFALPVIVYQTGILQFLLPIAPLVIVQIYYAKQKDERNLINDIAGILTFGVVGMVSAYLVTTQYHFEVLLHPTLFFIATTLYVKSVARERKNPRYLKASIALHLILMLIYTALGAYGLSVAYLIGFIRAWIIPQKRLTIKQIGLLEFPMTVILLAGLSF